MSPLETLRAWRLRRRQRGRVNVASWRQLACSPLFRDKSIALVGNAGYLAERQQGRRIDGCDLVIRMNNFRLSGFEPQLGRRTDVWLTNFYRDVDFNNASGRNASTLVSSSPNNFAKLRRHGVHLRHGPMITDALLRMGRRQVYAPTIDWFAKHVAQIGRYPSTGACGILLLLEQLLPVCGAAFITGFTFFHCRSHYFSTAPIDPTTNHDAQREQALLTRRLVPHLATGRIEVDPVMGELLRRGAGERSAA